MISFWGTTRGSDRVRGQDGPQQEASRWESFSLVWGCGTQRHLVSPQDGWRRMGFSPERSFSHPHSSGADAVDITPEEERWWVLDPRKPCSCTWLSSAPWRLSGPGSPPDAARSSCTAGRKPSTLEFMRQLMVVISHIVNFYLIFLLAKC